MKKSNLLTKAMAKRDALKEYLKKQKKGSQPVQLKANMMLSDYIYTLRVAAYRNDPEAQFELALEYDDGLLGDNDKKKTYWYERAAKLGHAEACNSYAFQIETGGKRTVSRLKKALKWYKLGMDKGSEIAKENYILSLNQIKKMERR